MEKPPEGSEWIHEIKYDGYRTQMIIEDGSVHIFTRNGYDWTTRCPAIEEAAAKLGVQNAIIDGEAVILVDGKPDYHALRRAAATKRSDAISLVAFDLLHLDGHDLRNMLCEDRRHLLNDLVGLEPGMISFSQSVVSSGQDFYQAVDKLGLEGMVSKRADGRYCSGRSTAWLKIKCYDEAMLQVIGVVRKPGKATQAILADHKHRYVGKAAVTLNNEMRERLWDRVKANAGPMPAGLPKDVQKNKADWLQPGLVARVRFLKGEETLRHATLREVQEEDRSIEGRPNT